MKTYVNPSRDTWLEILLRPENHSANVNKLVGEILRDVKYHGDAAIKIYANRFDRVKLKHFKVSEQEITEALPLVEDDLKNAILQAKENIEKFHLSQKENVNRIETSTGVYCWRKSVAIDKVGLYIPGGTAPLFSTLLMLGVPAVIAGCKKIMICTPPDMSGKVNPIILYVAHLLGIKHIYKIGGAQAIAAMAYGTATIPFVYKIFGPGNQYVTTAKQIVNGEGTAIDIPAGPSEVAVYADETCDPSFVAADLLSQAEHGIDSDVLLVASSLLIIDDVQSEIELQLAMLDRKQIIAEVLSNSRFVVMENADEAFCLLNEYAPEHLIIASDDAEALSEKVVNAGSVFLGHYSPESAGDYASGTNHTLPTHGFAKAYSGVSLDSFLKKITFQQLSKEGLINISGTVTKMAESEGLDAHANAVTVRLK